MTKERAKHWRQLWALYAVLFATGYLWNRPHTPVAMAILVVVYFGICPWLVLRQPDYADT